MDEWTAAYVVVGAAAAGFVQGLSGFAFAMVALALWAWTLDPVLAGPLVVFSALFGQVATIGSVRKSFNLARSLPFIAGGAAGVPIGVALLKNIDPTVFRLVVGVVLAGFCTVMLFSSRLPKITFGGRLADGGIGFVGGIMGGIAGLSGAVPTLWTSFRGWKKDVQRAVYQSFNLAMHAITLTLYALAGLIDAKVGLMFIIAAPAMLIPALVGAKLYKKVSEAAFRRIVLGLLAISGIVLVASAARQLLAG